MPYKANNGTIVPNCSCITPPNSPGPTYCHGNNYCCGFEVTCCKFNCSCLDGICGACRGPCKPICEILAGCDGTCAGLLDIGPEVECKTVGGELTMGMAALEDLCGVIHSSSTAYPAFLPSNLFLLCCLNVPICSGQDEKKTDDLFEKGESSPVSKMKLCNAMCSANPACRPHATLSQGICGLCMDPIFAGSAPCWYCTETIFPPVFTKLNISGTSASKQESLLDGNNSA